MGTSSSRPHTYSSANIHKKMNLEKMYSNNYICKTYGKESVKRNHKNTFVLNPEFICNCLNK